MPGTRTGARLNLETAALKILRIEDPGSSFSSFPSDSA